MGPLGKTKVRRLAIDKHQDMRMDHGESVDASSLTSSRDRCARATCRLKSALSTSSSHVPVLLPLIGFLGKTKMLRLAIDKHHDMRMGHGESMDASSG